MMTDKNELFHKRIARVERINGNLGKSIDPRRVRRVIGILRSNHEYLWARHPETTHPGKAYRRALSRYS